MQIKTELYEIIGMNKDLSYKSFNPNYSFDNKNIRLTVRDDNGLLRVSNEVGNKINWFTFKSLNVNYSYLIQMFRIFRDILYNFKQLTSSYIEIYRDIYYSNSYTVDAYIYESRDQYNHYTQFTGAYVYETTNI